MGLGEHFQVYVVAQRLYVSHRRTGAPTVRRGGLIEAGALLSCAVKVIRRRHPRFNRGPHKSAAQGMPVTSVTDVQRAILAVQGAT
ncbi:hypothetical protein D3C81_1734580 [compost metagenome]